MEDRPPTLAIAIVLAICTLVAIVAIVNRPVKGVPMTTSYHEIEQCVRAEPDGLTAKQVAAKLRIPSYRANTALSKLAMYQRLARTKTDEPGRAFRYRAKETA